jgi:N-methylhydantoinase B
MTMEGDKHTVRPWGYKGGLPGTPAGLIKNPDHEKPEYLTSKLNGYRFGAGESVQILVPSSGGYGDPLERPEEQVLEDVLDEIVSVETANRDYGVVIKDRKIDSVATKKKREEIREKRGEIPLYSN